MALLGVRDVEALRHTDVLITGSLREHAELRGHDVTAYARRGPGRASEVPTAAGLTVAQRGSVERPVGRALPSRRAMRRRAVTNRAGRPPDLSTGRCPQGERPPPALRHSGWVDRILEELRARGGAARFGELGTSRSVLARAVEHEVLEQPARGCYALPDAPREIVAAVRLDGALSCVSLLRFAGLTVPGDAAVTHVSVAAHRGSSALFPGIRRHFEDVPRSEGRRLVPVPWALARAATCLPYDDAVVLLDSMGREAPVGVSEEALAIVAMRRPGLARDLRVDIDSAARSATETRVRLGLRRAGLAVAAGVLVPGVGEVDLLVEGVLIVELDGFAYHSGRSEYVRDRRRDRAALRLGLLTLRFAYEDSDIETVLAAVRRTLGSLADRSLPAAPEVGEAEIARLEAVRAFATRPGTVQVGRSATNPLVARGRSARFQRARRQVERCHSADRCGDGR